MAQGIHLGDATFRRLFLRWYEFCRRNIFYFLTHRNVNRSSQRRSRRGEYHPQRHGVISYGAASSRSKKYRLCSGRIRTRRAIVTHGAMRPSFRLCKLWFGVLFSFFWRSEAKLTNPVGWQQQGFRFVKMLLSAETRKPHIQSSLSRQRGPPGMEFSKALPASGNSRIANDLCVAQDYGRGSGCCVCYSKCDFGARESEPW